MWTRLLTVACAACCMSVLAGCQPERRDMIVILDANVFDNHSALNANNQQFYKNLLTPPPGGGRGGGKTILFHVGHQPGVTPVAGAWMGAPPHLFKAAIESAGFTVVEGYDATHPLTNIGPEVWGIFLITPGTHYSDADAIALRKFLADSGRLVFVGELGPGGPGAAIHNALLSRMGSGMTAVPANEDCNNTLLPASSLRPHWVTTGMTGLLYSCGSVLVPDQHAVPFLYNKAGTKVLGAAAAIAVR